MDYTIKVGDVSKNLFDIPFDEFGHTTTQTAVNVVRSATSDFALQMINIAPVDTSRYVSNMNVSFDTPDYSHDVMKFLSRSGALAQTTAKIATMRPNVLQTTYITNTISYAGDIELRSFVPDGTGVFAPTFFAVALYYKG